MSDADRPSAEAMARQARLHLDSLRAAGVEWLPDALPPEPEEPPAAETTAGSVASLPVVPAQGNLWGGPAAVGPSLSREERLHALASLRERVAKCNRCTVLAARRTQTVFGVGPLDPELCFVGEAPGADEDRQGEPFVGAAGQLLNRIIAACGMKREEVFICNILRCRPPENRLPLPDEAANCREFLEETLALVRPKFLCCLGACAAQNLLQTQLSVGRLRNRFHDYNGITVTVTYHPAYLLRNPVAKKDVWEDMKKLLARMGKPVPGGK
jgi:DNA polymerase